MTLTRRPETPEQVARDAAGAPALVWLGQAGFLIRAGGITAGVDLYLSDSLAEKYSGKIYPHTRMIPVPVAPENLTDLAVLLATHGHTDHLDPGTIPPLVAANPELLMVVPRAEREKAIDRGADPDRIVTIDGGEQREILRGWRVTAVAAAHEELTRNDAGEHLYLGYLVEGGGIKIFHSGDGIPYPGLVETVAALKPDIALLPVNGRDEIRRSRGVPGNFTMDEALNLCRDAGIPHLVPMHFGMFDFNTVSVDKLVSFLRREAPVAGVGYTIPEIGTVYEINR